MSEKHITRRTIKDRRAGKTDWEYIDALTDEEVEAGAVPDADNPPWTEEQLRSARLVLPDERTKVPVYIRLDPEIVDYFKSQGTRYQTRINAVLRSYVRGVKEKGSGV